MSEPEQKLQPLDLVPVVQGNGQGNGVPAKKLGGVTGKGFMPGRSGNPGGSSRRQLEAATLTETIRRYFAEIHPRLRNKRLPAHKKTRLYALIEQLAKERPELLFAYCFGKPVEMVEHAVLEHAPFEFVIKVRPEDLP